jgi:hypothetical protein
VKNRLQVARILLNGVKLHSGKFVYLNRADLDLALGAVQAAECVAECRSPKSNTVEVLKLSRAGVLPYLDTAVEDLETAPA